MHMLALVCVCSAGVPLVLALAAARRTTLVPALCWGIAAWLGWIAVAALAAFASSTIDLNNARYVALALTGCAGVAVFGARRPMVGPWNLVVAALFGVMLLPLAERVFLGIDTLDWLRWLLLGGTLTALVANYLPTRFGLAAVLLGLSCGWESWQVLQGQPVGEVASPGWFGIGAAMWLALALIRGQKAADPPFNDHWRQFRDAYGLVWAQRVREQFNNAALNRSWRLQLGWSGLYMVEGHFSRQADHGEPVAMLRALLRRFNYHAGSVAER